MNRIAPVLAVVVAASAAVAQPVFINLGTGFQANDVSADGTVVAGTHNGLVFRWTATGGFQNLALGQAPVISADGNTMAWGLSGVAKRWTSATGVVSIGTGSPEAISGDGSTIVGTNALAGFVYRQGSGMKALAPPPGVADYRSTYAHGVSYDGSVIAGGYTPISPNGSIALRWNMDVATALGPIPGYTEDIVATAVSGDGNIVYGFGRGQGGYDMFRWTAATGVVGLGVGAAGFSIPDPFDVSGDGNIIVGASLANAIEWRLGAGPRDLKEVLETDFGMDLSNYTLEQCRGISADGRTLVGFGTDLTVGQRFGFVISLPWSIPGPGAGSMLIVAGLAATRRRRVGS
jgi:hypothetical protein